MYILTKDIIPGCVVWANKKVYYDKPGEPINEKRSMFLITLVNKDCFLGCPLTKSESNRNKIILYKNHYPLQYDSRVTEELHELKKDDIYKGKYFVVSHNTLEYFKRNLFQRISINEMLSPKMYSDMFAEDYIKDHHPVVDSIAVYPSEDKIFKYYYIYDELDQNYFGVRLNRQDCNNYRVVNGELETIPKNKIFYDYYKESPISKEEIEKHLAKTLW